MAKIMFVGDLHLSPRIPLARKDDYPTTLLNKFNSLKNLAHKEQITSIVYLGDLFNTRHMTLSYFIKCFQVFKDIDNLGITQYLIIGNHDILYNNEDMIEESPIQLLLDSGVVSNKSFTIENTKVSLFNYTTNVQDITKADDQSYFNILVGHYFYDFGFSDKEHSLDKDICSNLGYQAYVLGHDHTPYPQVITKKFQVHRPGSFSRGTSQTCQVNRDKIQVLVYDTSNNNFSYLDIPDVLPSRDIYKEDHLIEKVTLTSISESLQDLLADLNFNNSSDIIETLNTIPMSDEVRALILEYLEAEGVYDTGGDLLG